ncbi:hypothetical protein KLP28_03585 [Nocardioidaceae bacterium]|nr:hypothetical protein KLP28_03585 [Nocardioidaceae bacterium]
MESDEIRMAEASAERAEVAPWLDYPANPWWYAPAGGAWFGALVAASAREGSREPLPLVVLFALAAAYFWWARRRWGTWPRLSSMPPEFVGPATVFSAAMVVLFIGGLGLTASLGPAVGVPVVAVAVAGVLWWYDHAYARASRRTAARLGTTSRVR